MTIISKNGNSYYRPTEFTLWEKGEKFIVERCQKIQEKGAEVFIIKNAHYKEMKRAKWIDVTDEGYITIEMRKQKYTMSLDDLFIRKESK